MSEHSKKSPTVSFRLSPEYIRLLSEEAARTKESLGESARRLLTEVLAGTQQQEIQHELDGLHKLVKKVREDFATLALVLLVKVGNEDPEKAEQWIRKNLSP